MSEIHYVIGDATEPLETGNRILAHGCNNFGAWGAGFTRALTAQWPQVVDAYDEIIRKFPLPERGGQVSLIPVQKTLWVAHVITQHGLIGPDNPKPVRYEWLEKGFRALGKIAPNLTPNEDISIHMPRIGCGLGGGQWEKVEPLIQKYLCDVGLDVYVYDLPT